MRHFVLIACLSLTPLAKAFAAFDRKPHEERFGARDTWTRKWLTDYWLEGMFGSAFDEARGMAPTAK